LGCFNNHYAGFGLESVRFFRDVGAANGLEIPTAEIPTVTCSAASQSHTVLRNAFEHGKGENLRPSIFCESVLFSVTFSEP
jgi:hypothetical protein